MSTLARSFLATMEVLRPAYNKDNRSPEDILSQALIATMMLGGDRAGHIPVLHIISGMPITLGDLLRCQYLSGDEVNGYVIGPAGEAFIKETS